MKVVGFLIVFILVCSFSPLFADEFVDLAKDALKLNEFSSNYSKKKEAIEKFADLKEVVQADLKHGNTKARVDIYLLLDGLIQDNLSSLQSFLATSSKDILLNEFSSAISLNYSEKLSYAEKENKQLQTTEFRFLNSKKSGKCDYYVNGKKIDREDIFIAPVSLSYYVASYCKDRTFALKKVQSEIGQKKYEIKFSNYQNIGTLFVNNENYQELSKNINVENNNNTSYDNNFYSLAVGSGYNHFFSYLKDQKISNYGLGYGDIVYYASLFRYKLVYLTMDFASIDKELVAMQNVALTDQSGTRNSTTSVSTQVKKGTFLRPGAGLKNKLLRLNDSFELTSSFYTNITFIQIPGDVSIIHPFLGLGFLLGSCFYFAPQFSFQFDFGIGADFPNQSSELVIKSDIKFAYNF